MAMHEYTQVVRGIPTTVLLSDEDAELAGLTKKDRVAKSAFAPVTAQGEHVEDGEGDGTPAPDPFAEAGIAPLTVEETIAVRALLAAGPSEEGGEDVSDPETPDAADGSTPAEPEAQPDGEKADKPASNRVGRRPANKAASPAADK